MQSYKHLFLQSLAVVINTFGINYPELINSKFKIFLDALYYNFNSVELIKYKLQSFWQVFNEIDFNEGDFYRNFEIIIHLLFDFENDQSINKVLKMLITPNNVT